MQVPRLFTFGGFVCGRREVFLQVPSRRIAEAVRDAMPVLFDLSEKNGVSLRAVLGHWLFGYGPYAYCCALWSALRPIHTETVVLKRRVAPLLN